VRCLHRQRQCRLDVTCKRSPQPGAAPGRAGGGAPVATAPGQKPSGEEPPLISFD